MQNIYNRSYLFIAFRGSLIVLIIIVIIIILMLIFNSNEITFCMDNDLTPANAQLNLHASDLLRAASAVPLTPYELELLRAAALKGLTGIIQWPQTEFFITQLKSANNTEDSFRIRMAIYLYAQAYNVDLEPYLFPNIAYPLTSLWFR